MDIHGVFVVVVIGMELRACALSPHLHFKNFLFFETESYYVAQTGLKLMGNLSEPPLGWKSGHLPYTN